jgi:hypothetical protein
MKQTIFELYSYYTRTSNFLPHQIFSESRTYYYAHNGLKIEIFSFRNIILIALEYNIIFSSVSLVMKHSISLISEFDYTSDLYDYHLNINLES